MSKAIVTTDSRVLERISTIIATPRRWVMSSLPLTTPVLALYEGEDKAMRLTVEFDYNEAIPIPDNAKVRLDGSEVCTVDMLSKAAQDELWHVAKQNVNSIQDARTSEQLKRLDSIDQNSAEVSE